MSLFPVNWNLVIHLCKSMVLLLCFMTCMNRYKNTLCAPFMAGGFVESISTRLCSSISCIERHHLLICFSCSSTFFRFQLCHTIYQLHLRRKKHGPSIIRRGHLGVMWFVPFFGAFLIAWKSYRFHASASTMSKSKTQLRIPILGFTWSSPSITITAPLPLEEGQSHPVRISQSIFPGCKH